MDLYKVKCNSIGNSSIWVYVVAESYDKAAAAALEGMRRREYVFDSYTSDIALIASTEKCGGLDVLEIVK